MEFRLRIKGILLVVFGSMLWGISGSVAQFLFQRRGFSPEWLVEIRMLVSGIILLIYSVIAKKQNIFRIWKVKKAALSLLLFGIIGMVGVQYSYFAAIKYGNAATATILQYLSTVIIVIYCIIKTRKMPSLRECIAVVFAIIGTIFIITKGNINSMSISNLAVFWGVFSAFGAAFYTVQPRLLLAKWGSLLVVGWGMLIGGAAFSFIHKPWTCSGKWSITSVIAIAFVILFGTLIAFTCYLESLKYIRPTETSVLSSAEPLSAAVLSVVWLHVSLGIMQWIGIILIIVTIIILAYEKSNSKA